MSKGKYRVAIVGGAGSWGRNYTRAYAEHPDCEIAALVERAEDRGRAFATHYGIPMVYSDIAQLLADEVPDIVSAILPVAHTHDVVMACADAGVKVVSCEKPIDFELARADETVRICKESGTVFGCGTALWMWPHIRQAAAWIRAGHIGEITGATIPHGLPTEVSGGGCHLLVVMQHVVGLEAEWVEGWILPPEPDYVAAEVENATEIDCPAYGRIGFKGGAVCELPRPRPELSIAGHVGITGTQGQVWLMDEGPVCILGKGVEQTPVRPDFFADPTPAHWITPVVDRLVRGVESGVVECTGHDYRQALEIAMALTLSAHNNHQRVNLPLVGREQRLYPSSYRLHGGDVTGWEGMSPAPELQ